MPISTPANTDQPFDPKPRQAELADHRTLVDMLQHAPGSVSELTPLLERPIYATTLYLARCTLDTRFGRFRAFIFQDLVHKAYTIALTYGDVVHASELYTRLHSSCVTSETLRACDCDCVQQLEGALRRIAEKGSGILFYLMQEGRGVGYVAKARNRMLVQASHDRLSTFEAYHSMGLRKDHRSYDTISHICHLLGISAPFVLLTNNPDKVAALEAQGLKISRTESLEFEPSPFNLAYLASKAASGHALRQPRLSTLKSALPPEPVVPFKPHALPEAQRFIYSASYFLPMRPVDNEVLLSREAFEARFGGEAARRYMEGSASLVLGFERIRNDRFIVRIDSARLQSFRREHPDDPVVDLLTTPYWFRVHVYFDIVTSQEFVVLTYGTPQPDDAPVVRLQSESLFNRFPLTATDNRDKFEKSVRHIIHYGVGAILLLYFDGRGAGFGAYATDRMMTENGLSRSSDESYRKLAVPYDSRDYDASMILLRHHLPGAKIQMVMNSPTSLVRKKEYAEALNKHRIDIERWIFLDEHALGD
ncbi:MAG: GTP cyclohydrolase [Verrucomicrobia bacterium]|nr:MAG: GTP cyclohydrolase [Verrucomicrobiota bacterium]